ncbi:MAG: helical backbone metal receptor [Candidatus Competibacteraceae bacterium]|nr:helical backbone metal receptor [Candidatus Competibacteraceae bacterium]
MTQTLRDAIGNRHSPADKSPRIACLVPSLTELLFDLGLERQLVARTSFCIHPADRVFRLASVGGTKKIKHRELRALAPTHGILNIDENPRAMYEELRQYVPHIIVTHPQTPYDNPPLYRLLGNIFHRQTEAEALTRRFEENLAQLTRTVEGLPRRRVLYLIWKKPWMGVAPGTYIANTLKLIHWQVLPEAKDPPYPQLEMTRELLEEAELILFSSEPFPFKEADLDEFAQQQQVDRTRLKRVDGELTSWYGSRAIPGLAYLGRLARQV